MKNYLLYEFKTKKLKLKKIDDKENFLEFAYRSIQCELVEYAELTKKINIVIDEEGALKNNELINFIYDKNTNNVRFFYGNLLFVQVDKEATKSLTDTQIKYIKDNYIIDTVPVDLVRALF